MSISGVQKGRKIQILEALGRCLLKKSFRDTTMKDIAKNAGITHGGLNYYFKNKQDILFNFIDYMLVKNIYLSDDSEWLSEAHLDSIPQEKLMEEVLQFNLNRILATKEDLKILLEILSIANYDKTVEQKIVNAFSKLEDVEYDIIKRSGVDTETASVITKIMMVLFAGLGVGSICLKYEDEALTNCINYVTKIWTSPKIEEGMEEAHSNVG